MAHPIRRVLFVIIILALTLSACAPSNTTAERPPITAALSELEGLVQAKAPGEDAFTQVIAGLVLQIQSQIQTGADGKVRLDISDGTILRLGPQTLFTLEGEEQTASGPLTKVKVAAGQIFIILSGGALEVDTPAGVASVRGSYMEVRIDPDTGLIYITCLEGDCTAQTNGGQVSFSAGQTATITREDLPPELGEMSAEDVLRWLQNNPEATVVIVPLTATVAARATDTPEAPEEPSSTPTQASSATNTPVPPTNTPENPQVTLTGDALCMSGPGERGYLVVGTVFAGTTANVIGQSNSHWVIEFPGKPGVVCWIPKGRASANATAGDVRFIAPPPTITPTLKPTEPDPTETREPEKAPTATPCPTYVGQSEPGKVFGVAFLYPTGEPYYEYDPCDYWQEVIQPGSTLARALPDSLWVGLKQ